MSCLDFVSIFLNSCLISEGCKLKIDLEYNKQYQVISAKREIHLLIHEILKLLKTSYQGNIFLFIFISIQKERKRSIKQRKY